MPEVRIPFTYVVKGRYWQFRRKDLKAPLPGQPYSPEFAREYARLVELSDHAVPQEDQSAVRWLIRQYLASAEFQTRRPSTQSDYEKVMAVVETELGDEPFAFLTPLMVKEVRDGFSATPRKAHKVKQMVSLLYAWAGENGHVPLGFNPATGFKRLKVRAGVIEPWTEEEIAAFLAVAPMCLKTPIILALYTGQRREDVVGMDWEAYQGGFIRVRQSKTGEPLDIACHPALRKHLAAVRTEFGGKIARTARGRPFTATSVSQAIRRLIDATGCIPHNRSIHGLRYAAAARLEEAGVTTADIGEVLGHRTHAMAVKYLSQRKRSARAIAKMASNDGESC